MHFWYLKAIRYANIAITAITKLCVCAFKNHDDNKLLSQGHWEKEKTERNERGGEQNYLKLVFSVSAFINLNEC